MAINHGNLSARLTPKKTLKGTVQTATIAYESDYERLTNKPSINNIEVIGDLSLNDLGIVNNVQPDWEQDDTEAEDYIKNKPAIPGEQIQSDWQQTNGDAKDFIKNKPHIPEYLKELQEDATHRTVKDAEIVSWNQKSKVVANPGNTLGTLSSIGINGTNYAIQGGGGGGAVDSVNGKTGDVILDAEDVGALPNDTPLFSGDYDDLTNKPTIPDDLADLNEDSTHRLVTDTEKTTWNGKSDFSGSYTDLTDKPTLGTASAKDYVNSVVDGSSDLVTSDAVHDYVDSAISGVYKPSGNKTCAELLPTLLIASNLGNVYNMTDSGVTTSDFVEGAGKSIEVGDNVVIVDVGTQNNATYKFDLLSGMVDLSNYIQKSATSGLMKNDGSVDTNSYATTSQIPDITGKADKVTSAVEGNFAGLDSNGNLTDSGHKHSDYLTQHQDISGKADKVTGATNGNLAKLDANGNLADGGWSSDKTTTSTTGNPISISGLKSNQLAVNPIITLEPIQAGSGTPSPSNVRAISGYDKIEVLSCGVNVWDEVWELGELNAQGQNASSTTKIRSKNYIPVVGGSTYYLKLSSASAQVFICFYDVNKTFISSNSPYQGTFTVPLMARYCRFNCPATYGTTYNNDMGINYPATQTSYVASNKATSISESLGQTVYGGTLDLRSGKFNVTHGIVDLGDLTWEYISNGAFFQTITPISDAKASAYRIASIYDNSEVPSSLNADNNNIIGFTSLKYLRARDTRYIDATDFKTAITGQKLVYELQTPFTIQLTPREIILLKDYAYVSTNGTSIALDYHNGELASLADVSQLGETVNELGDEVSSINATVNELTQKIITKAVGGEGWIVPLKMGMLIFYGRNNNSKKGMGIVDQTNTFAPIVALDGCTITVSTTNNTVALVGTTAGMFTVIYP